MAILEVENLETSFFKDEKEIKVLRGVSFRLEKGRALGIVGESGSGKSVTVYSILRLLSQNGRIIGGTVRFNGEDLTKADEKRMSEIRGNKISIIFQDPMTSLNPTYTVGHQITEAILLHTKRTKSESYARAIEMLKMVNIPDPVRRMKQYPFELSGGMRQRIMIAIALACEPDILIADEPTTALDVTIQAGILDLLASLQKSMGLSIIMITHDLGVVAKTCDEVIVMYAGIIVEKGSATQIFYNPKHEYTRGLLRSAPTLETEKDRLEAIPGSVIDLSNIPKGCPFMPRCREAMKICKEKNADILEVEKNHTVRCWLNQKELYFN